MRLVTVTILAVFFLLPTIVSADAKTDYDYQYTRYRDSYLEFTIFKKDYLATPSLDNQQKVLLSLKQSLVSRDLAKASLAWYLSDLINLDKVKYEPFNPILASLSSARQYYTAKADEAQTVVTLSNLKEYDKNYLETSVQPERALRFGIMAHKLAKLVHIQEESLKAYESLRYKLPDSVSIRVQERLVDLDVDRLVINQKIDEISGYLLSKEGQESVDSPVFFSGKVEKFIEIRELQITWVDKLIDLDLNYAKI